MLSRRALADPDIKKLEHKEVRHNIRRAERSHVKYEEIKLRAPQYQPPDDVREEIEAGLERWKANRHGTQIAAVRSRSPLPKSSRPVSVLTDDPRDVCLCSTGRTVALA